MRDILIHRSPCDWDSVWETTVSARPLPSWFTRANWVFAHTKLVGSKTILSAWLTSYHLNPSQRASEYEKKKIEKKFSYLVQTCALAGSSVIVPTIVVPSSASELFLNRWSILTVVDIAIAFLVEVHCIVHVILASSKFTLNFFGSKKIKF